MFPDSLHLNNPRRIPCALAGWQDRRRCFLRPIEPQEHVERSIRSRKPIGFVRLPRRLVLYVNRQGSIGILFHRGNMGVLIR